MVFLIQWPKRLAYNIDIYISSIYSFHHEWQVVGIDDWRIEHDKRGADVRLVAGPGFHSNFSAYSSALVRTNRMMADESNEIKGHHPKDDGLKCFRADCNGGRVPK